MSTHVQYFPNKTIVHSKIKNLFLCTFLCIFVFFFGFSYLALTNKALVEITLCNLLVFTVHISVIILTKKVDEIIALNEDLVQTF
jgi:hypothetical protein